MQLGAMNDPRKDLNKEIRRIADAGFDFLDLTIEAPSAAADTTDWQAVRNALDEVGLQVLVHAAPYLPINNPSGRVRQAALDELRRTIDVAKIVGATLCTTHFVGWPEFLSEEAGYEYYRQAYTIVLAHGKERGIEVSLENSPNNSHQLKYFREIFFRLPDLKLTFDIGHGNVKTARSMTRDYLFALNDRLAHANLSDNDGSADDHLPIGVSMRNGINLLHELKGLRDFRYDGTITLEIFGDNRWLMESARLTRETWARSG